MLDTAKTPMFMHVLTVQTHGGYEYKDYDNAIPVESPAGEYPWTEQFLGALSESEMDLQAFIEQLEGRDRPTLVMFYGDHIPAIEDSYLKEVVAPSDDLYAYKTFYGAWANYELPELSVNEQEYLSINYLYASVMANAKLPLTGYQKFLLESADAYPVISVDGLIDSNGDVVPLERARETCTINV